MVVVKAGIIKARSGGIGLRATPRGVAWAAVVDTRTLAENALVDGGSDVGSTCKRSRGELDFKRAREIVLDPIEKDDELIFIAPRVG